MNDKLETIESDGSVIIQSKYKQYNVILHMPSFYERCLMIIHITKQFKKFKETPIVLPDTLPLPPFCKPCKIKRSKVFI